MGLGERKEVEGERKEGGKREKRRREEGMLDWVDECGLS
jgi:hypothetical protein